MFPVILVAFNEVKPAPEPTKFVADRVLVPVFQVKLLGCIKVLVPFPTNIEPAVKVVAPVPPRLTDKTPDVILVAFNEVKL